MRNCKRCLLMLVFFVSTASAHAEFNAAARAGAVAPLIDDQTVAVAHVDLKRVDVDSLWDKAAAWGLLERVPPAASVMLRETVRLWLGGVVAAGGSDLYFVFSLADVPLMPVFAVVPLESGADSNAVAAFLALRRAGGAGGRPEPGAPLPLPFEVSARLGNAVIGGSERTLERLRSIEPDPRPELAEAFAAAGDTAAQFVLIPTADNRRVIEEVMPVLPDEIGGGPSTAITRGVMWAAIGVEFAPDTLLRSVVRSQDGAAAEALSAAIERCKGKLGELAEVQRLLPNFQNVARLLTPAVKGDTLMLSSSEQEIVALLSELFAPVLGEARMAGRKAQSRNNMHNVFLGCMMYRQDHDKEWPKDLQEIAEGGYLGHASVLWDPTQPTAQVPYVYVRPDKDAKAGTAVIYEAHDTWPMAGVNVGFVDGGVMLVKDEARFKKILETGR